MFKRDIKKWIASLLVVSTILNQIPYPAWASEETTTNEISVLKFDTEKLSDAVTDLIEEIDVAEGFLFPESYLSAHAEYSEDPDMATASNAQKATPSAATRSNADGIDYSVTISYEEPIWEDNPFQELVLELKDAEILLSVGTELPERTGVRVFFEPDSNGIEYDDETESVSYCMTGEERISFMIINEDSKAQAYQLQFGKKITNPIIVESKKQMLKEYKKMASGEDDDEQEATFSNASRKTKEKWVATHSNASAATESTATKEKVLHFYQTDQTGYEKLEADIVNLLTRKKFIPVSDGLAAILDEDIEYEETETIPKSSNTNSAGFVTFALSEVTSARQKGNGLFSVNIYDYAPYSGLITKNSSGASISPKYDTDLNRNHMNAYLASKGSSLRFGRPYSAGSSTTLTGAYNDYVNNSKIVSGTAYPYYYNITQGIPDLDGGNKFQLLFPEKDQTYSYDVNGDGTIEKDATIIKVYEDINTGDPESDNAFLKKDEDGYYSYDSDTHKVVFDTAAHTLRRGEEQTGSESGFWPFGESNTSNRYYFGLTLDFDFYKPVTGTYLGQDMTYRFSGDDDVLVYLTNIKTDKTVLALDMGGVHDRTQGTINLATGEIKYEPMASERFRYSPLVQDTNGNNKYPSYSGTHLDSATKEKVSVNPVSGPIYVYLYDDMTEEEWKAAGYADCLYFPKAEGLCNLKLYYMERGDGGSNCSMRFNLPAVTKSGITLEKRTSGTKDQLIDESDELYTFDFVYADDEATIWDYYTGVVSVPAENKQTLMITGNGIVSSEEAFDRLTGGYFYLVRTSEHKTTSTIWTITGANAVSGSADSKTKTAIYQVDTENTASCYVIYENVYHTTTPTVENRAWKDPDKKDGTYKIEWIVEGDTAYTKTSETTSASQFIQTDSSDIIVTEQLSSYVELPTDTTDVITIDELTGPKIYLSESEDPIADGNELYYRAEGRNILYGDSKTFLSSEYIVSYDPDTKTLTWNTASKLGKGEFRSLYFKIRVSDEARYSTECEKSDSYSYISGTDTGTYAEKTGYPLNLPEYSKMTYDGNEEGAEIPNPAVRPVLHSIELQKTTEKEVVKKTGSGSMIAGTLPSSYEVPQNIFEISFETRNEEKLEEKDLVLGSSDGGLPSYSFDAASQKLTVKVREETVIVTDLPRYVTGYTVREILPTVQDTERLEPMLISIQHNKKESSEEDLEKRETTHSFGLDEQSDQIIFKNQYRYRYGKLILQKELTEILTKDDVTFSFTIQDKTRNPDTDLYDTIYAGNQFFAAVTIEKDQRTDEIVLEVPAGNYQITENGILNYETVSSLTAEVIVTEDESGKAVFKNRNKHDGYLFDWSNVINTVTKFGFRTEKES